MPNKDLCPILPSPNPILSVDDSALPSIRKAGTTSSRKVKVFQKAAKKGDDQKHANAKLMVGQAVAKPPAALVTQSSMQHTTKNKKPPAAKSSPSTETVTQSSSAHLLFTFVSLNPVTNVTSATMMNRTVDTNVHRKCVPIKSRCNNLADAIETNGVSFLTGKENVSEEEAPSSLKRPGQSEASSAPQKKRAKVQQHGPPPPLTPPSPASPTSPPTPTPATRSACAQPPINPLVMPDLQLTPSHDAHPLEGSDLALSIHAPTSHEEDHHMSTTATTEPKQNCSVVQHDKPNNITILPQFTPMPFTRSSLPGSKTPQTHIQVFDHTGKEVHESATILTECIRANISIISNFVQQEAPPVHVSPPQPQGGKDAKEFPTCFLVHGILVETKDLLLSQRIWSVSDITIETYPFSCQCPPDLLFCISGFTTPSCKVI
ncbi:hypothetical protein EV702DRAFT_1199663 [Suillus placidus]|uniref:Uncharacterized protein n=1 Tax=Suillus placidus TaxID=48579 RepID=A0A9P7D1I0_9AGAM|nr:hypothetical protein EV702DRAFT_1199663 [Suillus placidus]